MAFTPPILDFNFKIEGDEEIKRRFSEAGSQVQRRVRGMLEYLAGEVAMKAKARAPRSSTSGGKRLADFIGYRFTMGKSGIKPDEGDRVVVRSDIGARGSLKAKAYAVEMGHIGRRREVKAHMRRQGMSGARVMAYAYTTSSVKGSTISKRRPIGMRTEGGVQVSTYTRRFANKAQPFLGPAGEAMRPAIVQGLTVVLPRQLARLMSGEGAV